MDSMARVFRALPKSQVRSSIKLSVAEHSFFLATKSASFHLCPHAFTAVLAVLPLLLAHPESPGAIAATVAMPSWQELHHLFCSRPYLDGNAQWEHRAGAS